MLKKPQLAEELAQFVLAFDVLGGKRWAVSACTTVSASSVPALTAKEDNADSTAAGELAVYRESLKTEWLLLDGVAAQFAGFQGLAKKERKRVMTYCTVLTVTGGNRATH